MPPLHAELIGVVAAVLNTSNSRARSHRKRKAEILTAQTTRAAMAEVHHVYFHEGGHEKEPHTPPPKTNYHSEGI